MNRCKGPCSPVPKPKVLSMVKAIVSKYVPWMDNARPEFYFPEDGRATYLTLPFLVALPCLTLPCLTLPYLTLPYFTFTLPYMA